MMPTDSSDLMQHGIALLEANTPGGLMEALACFDAAIDLRRRSFTPGDHRAAYLLAASWMNRGDALARLQDPARLPEATHSYDEALAMLREVPPDADPLYRRRHAIAWMNRGLTLQQLGSDQSLTDAIGSFEQAIALTLDQPEHILLLASVLLNHAKVLLSVQPPRAAEAFDSATGALENVRKTAAEPAFAAEIQLKSHLILCRAAETLLCTRPDAAKAHELLCAATDAVEEGLALARQWEKRGDTVLGTLPTILFHFGIDLYRRRQPQFLGEFIRETLETSANVEWHRLAVEALAAGTLVAGTDSYAYLGTPQHEVVLENLQTLQFTRQRLQELLPGKVAEGT